VAKLSSGLVGFPYWEADLPVRLDRTIPLDALQEDWQDTLTEEDISWIEEAPDGIYLITVPAYVSLFKHKIYSFVGYQDSGWPMYGI
jgi:hypothetical protein